jgi:hypothetical protein
MPARSMRLILIQASSSAFIGHYDPLIRALELHILRHAKAHDVQAYMRLRTVPSTSKRFFENAQVDAQARACAGSSARRCTLPLLVRGRSSTR